MNQSLLDISWPAILKISVVVLVLYLLFLVKDILVLVLFALIISVLFEPAIDFLQKKRIPRIFAVVLIYLLVFGILSLTIYLTASIFANEIKQFSQFLPQYFEKISPSLKGIGLKAFEDLGSFTKALISPLEKIAENIINVLSVIFGGIFSAVFIIFLALFFSVEEKPVEKAISLFSPKKYEDYTFSLWTRCQKKVSGWFLSRILSSLFVGVLSYIAFFAFNVKYPFTLAFLSGILNFVPFIGPVITGVLIFIIVSLDNFTRSLFVLLAFIIIQLIENNLLTPYLSKKFIGLPSSLVLISLALGGVLWGFLGAILVIPLAGILFEFLRDFLKKKKAIESQAGA